MAINSKRPLTPEEELARRSRRSFIVLGAGAVAALAGWEWLKNAPVQDEIPAPLRSALGFNETVVRNALYSDRHLVRTYPASAVGRIKVNGDIGMEDPIDPARWHLDLAPMGSDERKLTLDDIRSLPRVEEIIDFKCVEGWSTGDAVRGRAIVRFHREVRTGVREGRLRLMQTPSKDYYIGIDMPSALHPQTLLAYEMNHAPLEDKHGAPLRLVVPVKYGIKNIKRIGRIEYTNARPADYWAEQGYDYYSGL